MKPFFHVFLILLFAGSAFAAPTINKDWMVDQGIDEVMGKDSCLAATNISSGTHRSQLLLSFPKDHLALPQLLLKVWDAPMGEDLLKIRISSKVSNPLFVWKKPAQIDEPTIYWYAPIGWTSLLDIIAGANNLTVQGTTLANLISLKGSSASLDQVEKCLKTSKVLPTDFLKQLNVKSALNESNYDSVDDWIKALESTFEIYRQGITKNQELAAVLKPAKKLIEQEAEASKIYDYSLKRWQSVTDELAAKRATELTLNQALAQAKFDLQALQTQWVLAQDNLKNKKASYEPILAKINALEKGVQAAERTLNNNISEAKGLQSRISGIEREIPELLSERDRLDREISNLQSAIDSTRSNYDSADWTARRYDVDYETRSDLSSDWRYNDLRRRALQLRDEARRYEHDARNFESKAHSTNSQLLACRQVPEKDCSSLENLVRDYSARAQNAQRQSSQSEREARTADSDAQRIAYNVQLRNENEKRRLLSIRDDWGRKLNGLQSEQDRARSRRSSLDREIPNLQSEMRSAQAKLSQFQAAKPGLETALANARAALAAAKVSLDFARIEKEYLNALAQVESLTKAVAATQKTISANESSLKNIILEINSLAKDLTRRTTTRDQAEQNLAAIRATLKPIRDQEAALNKEIASLVHLFEQGKSRYQKTYELKLGN